MKKILLICTLFATIIAGAVAQQLPNPGFENFEADNLNGVGQTPTGWNAANVKKVVSGVTAQKELVSSDAGGRTGNCVRIHNEMVGALGIEAAAPSWISLGKPWNQLAPGSLNKDAATAGTDGGINFKYRPDTLAVWIKRTYTKQENAHIVFYSWKGTSVGNSYRMATGECLSTEHIDEESDIRQAFDPNNCGTTTYATQIADGQWRNNSQFTDWTEIKVPITYMSNDVPEKMNIIISSGNYPNGRSTSVYNGSQLWADDIRLIYSSAAHEISLGKGVTLRGFSPDKLEYTYALGNKPLPTANDITLKRSGRTLTSSEYTIIPATAIGETMSITVKAEDGSSQTTYKITFIGEVSKNPRPAQILVGGEPINGFIPESSQYDVTLPFGTTSCPEITIVAAEEGQTISKIEKPTSLPGVAKVTVMAPDGATTQVYTLNLKVGAFDNATLTSISVNGKAIKGFDPNKTTYVVELPTGTTATPKIEYTTDYPEYQTIEVKTDGLNDAKITVTPQGSSKSNTYTLKFVLTASTYCWLDMITVGGKQLEGFAPDKFDYEYSLPLGTAEMPKIEYVKGDEFQTVEVTLGGLNGTTRISVTSQSGKQALYKITFKTAMSSVSTLAGISVNGTPIADFTPEQKEYVVELPAGVVTTPTIEYTKGDDYQTVTINNGGLNGKTYIVVKAQDGTTSTYTVTFKVTVSSNSYLKDILLDNISLEGFSPEKNEYHIHLKRGTQVLPEITYVKGDPAQTVTKIENGISGTTRITVRAGSGATTTYLLHFSVETNSDVKLKNIYLNGAAIEGFSPDKKDYQVILPSGTVDMPAITFEKSDEAQTVTIIPGGVNGTTIVMVRAEDGSEGTYSITMSVTKSENAFLQMIYIGGEAIADFEKDRFTYDYTIPADYPSCPPVTVDKEAGQQVMISAPNATGLVRITVTPESGSANVYTIDVHYPRSTNNMLMDITLDGISLDGFDPETTEYSVSLPYNTSVLPELEYTKSDGSQTIYVEYGGIEGDTKVNVRAEDGNVRTYTISFFRKKSDIATLESIFIDGTAIDGFSADTYDYHYEMPVSATESPVITYTKGSANQQVAMTVPAFEGTVTITTMAEDRSDTTHYTISLTKKLSSVTNLATITVTGTSFNGEVHTKTLTDDDFTDGTTTVSWMPSDGTPYVTYTAGDEYQTIATADAGMNGTEIIVIAEDSTSRKYTVLFEPVKSNKATLDGLQLFNSETREYADLESFDPTVYDYNVTLPQNAESVPNIYPIAGADGQTITINYGEPNGITVIDITSEDHSSTATYNLHFATEQSSVATLTEIFVDGAPLGDFFAENFDYTIEVSPDRIETPVLTWTAAEREQKVVYRAGNIFTPSTLTVTAQDGTTVNTYTINFEFATTDADNTLRSIMVGDVVINPEEGKTGYDVVLPYGTETMPEIRVIKQSDEEQNVVITYGGLNASSQIDVWLGDNKTTYTLNVSVSRENPVALTSLKVGDIDVNIENTADSVYIVNVPETPAKESITTSTAGVGIDIKSINPAKVVFETYSENGSTDEVKLYTVYFHYPTDIIPNADFAEWSPTTYNNAQKPTDWTAPADCAESYKYWLGTTYTTGHEVQNAGDGVVKLVTTGQWNSIAGSVPGMMTIGTMSVNLTSTGNSTSSVSGGITYRNTPEQLLIDYNPISNSNIVNWRMLMTVSQSETKKDNVCEGSFNNKNIWQTAVLPVEYDALEYIDMINITVNSANTENANGLGFTLNNDKTSELHVRNLRLYFDNLLSDIKVDGTTVNNFAPENYTYDVILDDDYQGIPKIETTGRVRDQQHRITADNNKAIITSMAEDGTIATYTLNFVRNISRNTGLKNIMIDGVALAGFDPAVTEYTCLFDTPFRRVPDVTVEKGSPYQTISYAVTGKESLTITVEAENRDSKTYTIHFGTATDNNATLAGLAIEGYDEFVFDSETHEYTIELREDQQLLPAIHAVRASQLQAIEVTVADTSSVKVTASDGSTAESYKIVFTTPAVSSTSILTELGEVMEFASDKFEYEHQLIPNEQFKPTFTPGSTADAVSQTFTDDEIRISVKGDSENTYSIRLLREKATSSALAALYRDGEMMEGFIPEITSYSIPAGRGEYPALRAVATDKATLTLDYSLDENGRHTFTFNATSEDMANTTATNVTLTQEYTAAVPSAILINGAPLVMNGNGYTADADFSPEVKEYTITMAADEPKLKTPDMPDITVMAAGDVEDITTEQGGFDNPTITTLRPKSNGIEQTYILNFRPQLSDNADLADLALDYESIADFDPERTEYIYNTNTKGYIPEVTYRTADAYQTVNVTKSAEEITIGVQAENGEEKTYHIEIITHVSSNAYLANITQDGIQLPGFSFNKTDYDVILPVGTDVTPEISAVAGADGQTITIDNGGVNGTTVISVTAADGETTRTYSIHYTLALSTDNQLKNIYIGAEPLADFYSAKHDYTVTLPVGTESYPTVTPIAGDYQKVTTSEADENGVVTITVTPQDVACTSTYTVRFEIMQSENSQLKSLMIDGIEIDGFSADKYDYTHDLPVGTDTQPEITWIEGDQWQTVKLTPAEGLNGRAQIEVTAQNDKYRTTYTVRFNRQLSENNTLNMITVAGNPIEGFTPDKQEYDIELPAGTTELPEVSVERGDEYQNVMTVSGGVNGKYVITVTSQSGEMRQYTLNFSTEKSHNALLAAIRVRQELIEGFNPEIFNYDVTLPYGARELPPLFYDAAEPTLQTVEYIFAINPGDTAKIIVTAEDGKTQSIYRIAFVNEKSNNAHLSGIRLGGELITTYSRSFSADKDFAPDVYDYNIEFPYGTAAIPEITYTGQVEDYESIELEVDSASATAQITVTSQDMMNISEYRLNFTFLLSDNALLKSIMIGGEKVKDYDPEMTYYTVTYPIGTDTASLPTASDITYELTEEGQTVTVTQNVPEEIDVVVTAPSGTNVKVYTIRFEIQQSDNTLLKDILVNGISISNFSPTWPEYTYLLFPGASIPTLEGVKSEESQTVTVSLGMINEPSYIYVEAEDGTVGEYIVNFNTTDINPGIKPSMDDVALTPLGDGNFKASSLRSNVRIMIYQADGRRVTSAEVGVVDPNSDIKQSYHEGGTVLHFDRHGQTYIYVFVYDNQVIASGKFIY